MKQGVTVTLTTYHTSSTVNSEFVFRQEALPVVMTDGGGTLAEAVMLTKPAWPLYVGNASLTSASSCASIRWPGSATGSAGSDAAHDGGGAAATAVAGGAPGGRG